MSDSETNFKLRKSLSWKAYNKVNKIWKLDLKNDLKIKILKLFSEHVFYGSDWSRIKKSNHNKE